MWQSLRSQALLTNYTGSIPLRQVFLSRMAQLLYKTIDIEPQQPLTSGVPCRPFAEFAGRVDHDVRCHDDRYSSHENAPSQPGLSAAQQPIAGSAPEM